MTVGYANILVSEVEMENNANATATREDFEVKQDIYDENKDIRAGLGIGGPSIKADLGPISIIALGFNICNSWASIASTLALVIAEGGTISLIYGSLVTTVAYMSTAFTFAELASVYPTAGGQYHFTSILAPKRFARSLSYVCGITSVFSWIAICASVTIIPAQQIMAIVIYHNEGFKVQPWHFFAIFQTINFLVLLYNIFLLRRTPWIYNIGFGLTISSFVVVLIVSLARASPKRTSEFVWTTWVNNTGWGDGICFIIGLLSPSFMYSGIDATLHLAEEVTHPTKTVPRAVMASVIIGFCTAFPFIIALTYCITDLGAVILTPTLLPSYELFEQATRSDVAATTLTGVGLFGVWFTLNAIQQASSRLTWSFARDNGFIMSRYLEHVHPTLQVPVYALVANAFVILLTGCVYLASSTAFNALVGSAVVLQQLSYILPPALLIYRRRSENFLPRSRPFRIPDWLGWTTNAIVVIFATITTVFFLFPVILPVTTSNMNYTVVIVGIMAIFTLINWVFHGRKNYQGPYIVLTSEE